MNVRIIGNDSTGYREVCDNRVVAFGRLRSDVYLICRQRGWAVVR